MGNSLTKPHKQSRHNNKEDISNITIAGYIRTVKQLYSIVPKDINKLVHKYYNSKAKLYLITHENYIYAADLHQFTKKIQNANKINFTIPLKHQYYMDSGSCITNLDETHDIIYKCGGIKYTDEEIWISDEKYPINKCLEIVIDRDHDEISNVSLLPDLPQNVAGNCLLHDTQFGLLSIGGYTERDVNPKYDPDFMDKCHKYIYKHSDNFYRLYDGKWIALPSMNKNIFLPSGVIFNAWNCKKMIVIGGSVKDRSVQMNAFDFDANEWNEIPCFHETCIRHTPKAGICYNEIYNRVYIGGGYIDVSEYDHIKDKWSRLPLTHERWYEENTLLWFDKTDHNLLFIGCSETNNMEYIDIRAGKNWKVIHSERYNKQCLFDAFGMIRDNHYGWNYDYSRLLFA